MKAKKSRLAKAMNAKVTKRISRGGFRFFIAGGGVSVGTWRDIMLAALTGLAVGLCTAMLHWMMDAGDMVSLLKTDGPSWYHQYGRWVFLVLPAAGALVGALIIRFLGHARDARGTDSAVWAYHHHGGHISSTVVPIKSVASVLTVGCGGSAGYEGPMTLIGAACGSTIARVLDLSQRDKRILMAAGLAAGIGALFRAPLAGALFGAEIFYSSTDMEYEAILPGFVASAIAYTVFCCFFGWAPLFTMPAYAYTNGFRLLPYIALAIVVTLGARFYIEIFRTSEEVFGRVKIPFWTKVIIGGLVTGLIGFFFPEVLGTSYGVIRDAFTTHDAALSGGALHGFPMHGFFLFFFMKVFATSMTVGSGGSGGVFAPALVCGASLGAGVGIFFQGLLPESVGINPGAFALIGMAGFTAAAIRIPLTAVVMVAEISGNHALLLPTMWVCSIAFWMNNGWTLYRSQVHSRVSSPLHG